MSQSRVGLAFANATGAPAFAPARFSGSVTAHIKTASGKVKRVALAPVRLDAPARMCQDAGESREHDHGTHR